MLITLARYFDPTEAHVVRALLESHGIPASVADANHVSANWPLSVALGGVRVQVPAEHRQPAQEIIAAYVSGDLQRELEQREDCASPRCSQCGGRNPIMRIPLQQKLLAIVLFIFGSATFPTRTTRAKCSSCHRIWHDAD